MEPMSLLAWIIVGAIAGWLASHVIASPFGLIGTILVGMLGAVVGGWLFREFGETGTTGLTVWSILVASVGALVLLFVLCAVRQNKL